MNKKKLLALLMALVMTFSLVPVTAFATEAETVSHIDVDGIEESVYLVSDGFYQDGATYTNSTDFYITSKEGLEYFRDLVNAKKTVVDAYTSNFTSGTVANFYQTNIFTNKTVHLLVDIDLNNEDWMPIGFVHSAETDEYYLNSKALFYGSFIGHGHTIKNLSIVSSDINSKREYGLFGRFGASSDQTISNLTINNVKSDAVHFLGAVAGSAGAGSGTVYFDNCSITGDINLNSTNMVGGLYGVGYGVVTNCHIIGNEGSTIIGYSAGAIAGRERCKEGYSITGSTISGLTISNYYSSGGYRAALVGCMADGTSGTLNITGNSISYCSVDGEWATEDTLICETTGHTAVVTCSNNTIEPQPATPVAQIGTTGYPSLAEAVAAAQSGDTIELIANDDVSLTSGAKVEIDKSLTINGNGHTIYGTPDQTGENYIFITGSGTVSINNLNVEGFGYNCATDIGHAPIYVSSNFTGTVNLTGVSISNFNRGGLFLYGGEFNVVNCDIDCANSRSGAFTKGIEIKGNAHGTISGTDIYNMERSSTTYSTAGIEIYGSGSVIVDNCIILSDEVGHHAVKGTYGIVSSRVGEHDPSGGSLVVNNTLTVTTNAAVSVADSDEYGPVNNYSITVNDCSFDYYIATWSATSSITINSGSFAEDVYAYEGTINIQGGEFTHFAPTGDIIISGGTFDAEPANDLIKDGYEAVDNNDGTWTVVPEGAVAVIGGKGYTTLQAAIAAANSGDTITLLANCTAATVSGGKNITFALNGHTLSGNQWVIGNATLTIDGTVANSEFYGCICVGYATNNNGNVVLNGGYYHCGNNDTVLHINGTCLDSDVTIRNARIESPSDNGIQLNGSGTFVIENSEITGATGVYVKSGVLTITDSTITGNMSPANYSYNGNGANATGDAIVIDSCNYPGGAPTVNIGAGNTFTGTKNQVGYYVYNNSLEGTVLADKAYTLSTNVPAKGWVANENETYKARIDNLTPVAEVNGNPYNTLESAVAAAQDNDTISLLANINLAYDPLTVGGYAAVAPENKTITLNLNSHAISGGALDVYGTLTITGSGTITGSKHGIWVNEGGVLNVQGGTITTDGVGYPVIANPGTVNISGGAVTNTTGAGAVYVNNGTLTISGGAVTSNKDDTEAVTVAGNTEATISGGTVTGHDWGVTVFGTAKLTVSDGATIRTADDEGYAICTNGNAGQNATVTINGGFITGKELGIYQPSGKLTVTGGIITGDTGIYFKSNSLNITGGTINGNRAEAADYTYNGNGANPTGDALVIDSCNYPNGINDVSVSGGNFNSTNAKAVGSYIKADDPTQHEVSTRVTNFITGGKYSSEPDSSYVADGYKAAGISGDTYKYQVGVVTVAPTTSGSINDSSVTFTVTTTVKEHEDSTEPPLESYNNLSVTVSGTSEEVVSEGNAATAVAALTNIKDNVTLQEIVSSAIEAAGTKITGETLQANVTIQLAKSAADTTTESGKVTYEVHPEAIIQVGDQTVGTVALNNSQIKDSFSFRLYALNIPGVETGEKILVTHTHDDGTTEEHGPYVVESDGYITLTGITSFSEFTLEEFTEVTASATYGYTISLEDSINIVLNVKNLSGEPADYTVTYTFKDVDQTVTLTNKNLNSITVASCAAKEMGEVVHVSVKHHGAEIKAFDLSIRGYCEQVISSSKNSYVVELCKAVLDYGRYAQEAFNYKTDDLVNGGTDKFTNANIVIPNPAYNITGTKPSGIAGVSATLTTTSQTQLVVYFKYDQGVNLSNYTIKVGDDVVEWSNLTTESSKIKVVVTGIAAKNLGNQKAVSISDGTDTYTIHISPVDYMGVAKNGSQAALNRAFYNYYLKAVDYFNNK